MVPGYVRCPKCHTALSMATTTGRIPRQDPGGTAMPDRRFPLTPVLLGRGVIAAMILLFGVRGGSKKLEAQAATAIPEPIPAVPLPLAPPRPTPQPVEPPRPTPPAGPTIADVSAASHALENALRQARLWGRVEATGGRVDLRSGSCSDRAMRPTIDGKAAMLHDAGLTKLRCLEQSGAVVFEREL